MNTYIHTHGHIHAFLVPAIFSATVGSVLTGFYKITEPKPRFFQTIYGFVAGGLYGFFVGGFWPVSITYLMFSDINHFFKNKQILQ